MIGRRFLAASSLLPAVATYALWTRGGPAPALLAALAAVVAVAGGRWAAPQAVERLAVGAALAAAVAGAPLILDGSPGVAGHLGTLIATAAFAGLACAGVRRVFTAPRGGRRLDVALEGAALVAAGMRRLGPGYPLLALAWLALAIVAMRAESAGPGVAVERERPGASAGVLAIAAAVVAALAVALPHGARLAERRLLAWVAHRSRAGFSDVVRLGSLDGLLQSDTVVLRVWGPPVDYLRGAAYDLYADGVWAWSGTRGAHRIALPALPAVRPVEVRFASRAQGYFLPLGARDVATAAGGAVVDDAGTLRPGRMDAPEGYAFAPPARGAEPDPAGATAPRAPSPLDLAVPPNLAGRLGPLAAAWTAGETSPRGKVLALAVRLGADYAYDVRFRRRPGVDPVLEFLFADRRGHCEYFASALALLARSAGVPARVVTGYRVLETNRFGGFRVVRERDAHAWVEAWLPGEGWRTFDATPAAEQPARAEGSIAALADAAWTGLGRAVAALRELTLGQTAALLGGALALLAAVRAWNARRGRRAAARGGRAESPAWFERLARALARAGQARAPSEPLERFARRLAVAGHAEAAGVVERYAALRYGGVGDAAALARDADACAARLRRAGA